VPCLIER